MTEARLVTIREHEPEPGAITLRWDCSCGWYQDPADAQAWWDHVLAALPAAAPAEGLRSLLSEIANDYTEAHLNVTSHSGTLGTRIRAALARPESAGSE